MTLKDQKINKVINVPCSYFVYHVLWGHPMSKMYKLFQVPKELFTKESLYDEAK